ncbi:MAG: DNA polymerase III subunit gamma/tau [Sphingomonadaceae bacterium]|nr:DNA polymerase III subunit gamma/tau [Sphingomonadaceae bacterium]
MALPETAPAKAADGGYRVLARKYRPQRFSELIGQEAMVTTLANAIRRGRIAHAFLMTGVRGVGKTSTARLIAKGLNCTGPDGAGTPTIDPCDICDACRSIAEGRHIDVVEMDAASHTGVDDIREIIEAVRYAAVSARYKIYIIDEVHMLSKNAFNALLKTLEEPPPGVIFIFATTEVHKVPITVLSRCQRFDLRRITPEMLFNHFQRILALESVTAEDAALRMIAAAADGSVRDGLSILDQAIAHAAETGDAADAGPCVTVRQVSAMLGLADGGAARHLLGHILAGDGAAALDAAAAQYALGVDPVAIVRSQMRLVHGIALHRAARTGDAALSDDDQTAIATWAGAMGMAAIQRLWQILLRVQGEVAEAADPAVALDMGLLRIAHATSMPDPDELVKMLQSGAQATSLVTPAAPATPPAAPPVTSNIGRGIDHGVDAGAAQRAIEPDPTADDAPVACATNLYELIDHLAVAGEVEGASLLRRHGRLITLDATKLLLARGDGMDDLVLARIARALKAIGPLRVAFGEGVGAPTIGEAKLAAKAAAEAIAKQNPTVAAIFEAFPDAKFLPQG